MTYEVTLERTIKKYFKETYETDHRPEDAFEVFSEDEDIKASHITVEDKYTIYPKGTKND